MSNRVIRRSAPLYDRRGLLRTAGAGSLTFGLGLVTSRGATAQTPEPARLNDMVIDLAGAPESIDPALAYLARDWSIVHSIYDSPLGFAGDGTIQPLAAESFAAIDDLTFEIVLRPGLLFHDGSPVTSSAISRSLAHIAESGSEASGLFAGITEVQEIDDLTTWIVSAAPSPWLPAQIAVWLLLLPEGHTLDQAATSPIGSGPYRFEALESGSSISLMRNPEYTWGSPKGEPMAEQVVFRFVPEVATRIADLSTGAAELITEIPSSQLGAVSESGAMAVETAVVGSSFIRIATETAPFDDVRVRQALNHAIDAQAIGEALVSPEASRLSSLFPDERSMAFNPGLEPYAYDPDRARQLLDEAELGEGFRTELEITSGARVDVAEAIAAQLAEVGITVSITISEYADFNATWSDSAAHALRLVTWSPLYDPHTLLSLVFASEGFLSRYANPEVDALIERAASEVDVETRASLYRDLSALMYEDVPAIYLWNLTAGYGVANEASAWQPRGDEYVIPTIAGEPV